MSTNYTNFEIEKCISAIKSSIILGNIFSTKSTHAFMFCFFHLLQLQHSQFCLIKSHVQVKHFQNGENHSETLCNMNVHVSQLLPSSEKQSFSIIVTFKSMSIRRDL